MREGNVDEYIATFELLGQCAQGDLDDPFLLMHFTCGLPKALADTCINMESPETFQEWKAAALYQQKNWIKKQALHCKQNTPNRPAMQGTANWTWDHNRQQMQANPAGGWCSQGNHSVPPPRPRLPPRNDNRMDTSTMIQKATTDKEKQEYHAVGWCFECGRQGHLTRDCPNKKQTTACTVQIQEGDNLINFNDNVPVTPPPIPLPSNLTCSLATRVARLSEEEQNAFIDKMNSLGENLGFQNT